MVNIERNEIFDLAYRFVTETSENIFLTGKAGTGKTTFLKFLKDNCTKNIVVAAPTGVAAINAGGVTLHSLFQLPFHPFLPTRQNKDELLAKIRYNKQRQQLLRKMELLVIDEISMVRCDVMDAIDTILRSVRRNYEMPFGGVQLLCIGDLHQLPPVAQNHEWMILQEYYSSPFFFDSLAIRQQLPLLIELEKIYRQKEDSFVRLLNKIRNNNMTADDFEDLHLRYLPGFKHDADEKYITLASHNKQADETNKQEIEALLSPAYSYQAVVENDFPEHLYPVEKDLVLKVGAQVMFLKNDNIYKRYFNGKIGVVQYLDNEEIIVDCDGTEISVTPETWENSRYALNRADGKLEQEVIGTFSQYPLRLAWAITIHKSQGLTFDRVMIDAGSAFSSGQVYVALSRCTSLDGIVLLSRIPSSAISSNEHVVKGQISLTHRGSLEERFEGARKIFTQQLLEDIFLFNEAVNAANILSADITQHEQKLDPGSLAWIGNLKQQLLNDKAFGAKFNLEVAGLMKEEGKVEKNPLLQKRISDAATYFAKHFSSYLEQVKNHPLVTEHRDASTVINEDLQQFYLALNASNYLLQYCSKSFSITSFLQHKLQFAQTRTILNSYASGKKIIDPDVANPELYNSLRRWRDMVCQESGQPIYLVANQNTLKEISTYLPLTRQDLLEISGFGKAKVDRYGDDILETVADYCNRAGIESKMSQKEGAVKAAPRKKTPAVTPSFPKSETKGISLALYKEGKDLAAIAAQRNLAVSTIESHLLWYVQNAEISIEEFVSLEKQALIREVVRVQGTESGYKNILQNLEGQDINYCDIRMVLAAENLAAEREASTKK